MQGPPAGAPPGMHPHRRELHYGHPSHGHPIADAIMSGVEQTIYMGSEHLFAKMFPSRIRFDPTTPLIVSTRYTDLVSIACSTLTRRAQSFAGQVPRTVGGFQPQFQALMEGICNAVDCGIRQRVYHTTEDWRLECEIAFSGENTPRPLLREISMWWTKMQVLLNGMR